MDLEINVDYEAQELSIIVDYSFTVSAMKEPDGTIEYTRINKLPEEQQEKFKKIVELLFELEDAE